MSETFEAVPVTIITDTHTYVPCPWCSEKASDITCYVERQESPPNFRPWTCESCGGAYTITLDASGVYVRKVDQEPEYAKLVLLCIPPQSQPIYFVVRAREYRSADGCGSGDEYFYNEHTCPTNWTRNIEMVIQGDSTDPHGFAEWIDSIPAGDLLDEEGSGNSGNTKLETLGHPFPDGGWQESANTHAKRVLALFGVEDDRVTIDSYTLETTAPRLPAAQDE